MTTIYFLRHAAKDFGGYFNPRLRHQDEPLSPIGLQTAERLVTYFADKPIAAIYISEYQWTRQTIEPTARRLQLEPVIDPRLNEMDNGVFDGLTDEVIQQTYPDVWQAYLERKSDFRFPEGETGEEVRQRISAFLDDKRQQHPDQTIVAVAHDGLIRLLMCTILRLPVHQRWDFRIDFAGIVEIIYQPKYDTWKLIRFNQAMDTVRSTVSQSVAHHRPLANLVDGREIHYYVCPVCGYDQLDRPPYANIGFPPYKYSLKPPYYAHYGQPSYDVCSCCGFEYGNDDEPGTVSSARSFQEYLSDWIENGLLWFKPDKRPNDWSLEDQLQKYGIPMPVK
ncbi:MAG: histidine phosphatase family protein [Chloroflexi bacterium]|nr:histidine phosphatase family protein [Chloroflexota bacterium]